MPLAGLSRVGEENSRFSSKRASSENGGQASLGERGPQQAPREPPGGSAARAASHTCLPRGLPAFPRGAPRAQGHLRRPRAGVAGLPPGAVCLALPPCLAVKAQLRSGPSSSGECSCRCLSPDPRLSHGSRGGRGVASAPFNHAVRGVASGPRHTPRAPPGPPGPPLGVSGPQPTVLNGQ